jgi:hypothetical protein
MKLNGERAIGFCENFALMYRIIKALGTIDTHTLEQIESHLLDEGDVALALLGKMLEHLKPDAAKMGIARIGQTIAKRQIEV